MRRGWRGVDCRRGRRVAVGVFVVCRGRRLTGSGAGVANTPVCCTSDEMLCDACWCIVAWRGRRVAFGGGGPGAGAAVGVSHIMVCAALRGLCLIVRGAACSASRSGTCKLRVVRLWLCVSSSDRWSTRLWMQVLKCWAIGMPRGSCCESKKPVASYG